VEKTIPLAIREEFGIKPGDEVYFRRSPQGILITTERLERLLRFDETLDELSQLLAEREQEEDFSIDVIFDEIRERRAEILREKYGIDAPND
jgi:bifunctional DNA-binding transcriptional regulator/antitoxin component of YhaV-PrlF toxin-antitoxin module